MLIKNICFVLLIFALYSCSNENKTQFTNVKHLGKKEMYFNDIVIDTVYIDHCNTSFLINSQIYENHIYMVDERFCWVYQIDSLGHISKRMLGQGRSNKEISISDISGYGINDGSFYFMGHTGDIMVFQLQNDALIKDKEFSYFTHEKREERRDDIKIYQNPYIYTTNYEKLTIRIHEDKLYYPIRSENPDFNLFSPDYFENTALIAEIDIQNQKSRVLGNMPPIMAKSNGRYQFSSTDYDIDNEGNFYFCCELDSLIYVWNSKNKINNSFGYAAQISMNDHSFLSMSDFRNSYLNERNTKCYYDRIKVIDEYIFRTYKKGNDNPTDGLQIYHNFNLIGDIDIPKNSWIIGKIGQWYYTNLIPDENSEIIQTYRFKL